MKGRQSAFPSSFILPPSSFSLVYVLADGVAQLFGLLLGEGAGDDAAVLKADDGDAAVHLEVEGEVAAVLQLEDERGRDARRAVGLKWHLWPSPYARESFGRERSPGRRDASGHAPRGGASLTDSRPPRSLTVAFADVLFCRPRRQLSAPADEP